MSLYTILGTLYRENFYIISKILDFFLEKRHWSTVRLSGMVCRAWEKSYICSSIIMMICPAQMLVEKGLLYMLPTNYEVHLPPIYMYSTILHLTCKDVSVLSLITYIHTCDTHHHQLILNTNLKYITYNTC